MKRPGFVTDRDICTEDKIENLDIYRKFLRPWSGLGCRHSIVGAEGEIAILSLDQAYEDRPISSKVVDTLDSLRPHIARAAMLAGQFQMERLRSFLSSLEALGIPAAVIDKRGKVKLVNQYFAGFDRQIGIKAFDKISITDPIADRLLKPRQFGFELPGDIQGCDNCRHPF